IAPDGEPYPYADSIEFRPIPDGQVRNQALQSGDINIMHSSNAKDIGNKFYDLREAGKANMFVSEEQAEVSFIQLNTTQPPFDDPRMRKALAMGADLEDVNTIMNDGLPTLAKGPYGPDSIGYVEDTGFPAYDLEAATKLVDEYVAEGGSPEFTLHSTTDASVKKLAELTQTRAEKVGVKVTIVERDQAAMVNDAIGKKYQAMLFRNYPGGDPDSLYVWFYSGTKNDDGTLSSNLVNFAGVKDDEVDRLLDEGRSEPDADKRKEIYQDLDRVMGSEVYGVWSWFTPWAVVAQPDVHNIIGPPLPGEDITQKGETTTDDPALQPNLGLATGHSLIGLWVK
ncbi:MAG: ABC transporter substrate-binding protein, partial [Aquihabitans sp.]